MDIFNSLSRAKPGCGSCWSACGGRRFVNSSRSLRRKRDELSARLLLFPLQVFVDGVQIVVETFGVVVPRLPNFRDDGIVSHDYARCPPSADATLVTASKLLKSRICQFKT